MNSLLLIAICGQIAVALSATVNTDDVISPDPRYDHHHDHYCCSKVEEHLNRNLHELETEFLKTFAKFRGDLTRNLGKLQKIEKSLKEQEDFDFAALQGEVNALNTQVEGVMSKANRLEKQEHSHHEVTQIALKLTKEGVLKNKKDVETVATILSDAISKINKRVNTLEVDLSEDIEEVKIKFNVNEAAISGLEDHTKELKSTIHANKEEAAKEFKKVKSSIESLMVSLDKLGDTIITDQKQDAKRLSSLEAESKAANNLLGQHEEEIGQNTIAISNLTSEVIHGFTEVKQTQAKDKTEISKLSDRTSKLEVDVNDVIDREIANLTMATSTNAKDVKTLKQSLAAVQGKVAEDESNIEKLHVGVTIAMNLISVSAKELEAVNGTLEAAVEAVKAKLQKSIDDVEAKITTDEKHEAEVDTAIAANTVVIEGVQTALSGARKDIDANALSLANLQTAVKALQASLDSHRNAVVEELRKLTAVIEAK